MESVLFCCGMILSFATTLLLVGLIGRKHRQTTAIKVGPKEAFLLWGLRLSRNAFCESLSMQLTELVWCKQFCKRFSTHIKESTANKELKDGFDAPVSMCTTLLFMGLTFGAVFVLTTMALPSFVAACIAPVYLNMRLTKHSKLAEHNLEQSLPEVYRSLSVSLAAGKSLQQACAYIAERNTGVLAEAFSRAAYEMELGGSAMQAISRLERSLPFSSIAFMGSALCISQKTGCALKSLFEIAATAVKRSAALARELRVKTSQAQLSSKIVSLLPLVLLLGMGCLSADFRAGIFTPLGIGSICIGLMLDFVGLVIIRSTLRVEL